MLDKTVKSLMDEWPDEGPTTAAETPKVKAKRRPKLSYANAIKAQKIMEPNIELIEDDGKETLCRYLNGYTDTKVSAEVPDTYPEQIGTLRRQLFGNIEEPVGDAAKWVSVHDYRNTVAVLNGTIRGLVDAASKQGARIAVLEANWVRLEGTKS